jgi:hypothetical protein
MQTLKSALQLTLATAVFLALGITAAWAPGSISLDEVMEKLKDNAKLVDEINAELKAQNLSADKIICTGARFGGNWTNLGGARAIPFNCEIGPRTLDIDGELHIYDDAGNELDMNADEAPAKATDYKQTNVTWKWG